MCLELGKAKDQHRIGWRTRDEVLMTSAAVVAVDGAGVVVGAVVTARAGVADQFAGRTESNATPPRGSPWQGLSADDDVISGRPFFAA